MGNMNSRVKKLLFLVLCSFIIIGYLSVNHISVLASYPGWSW
ncbi:membrane protein [Clostridium acetobutylicum EA 2018]|uniref:Predicted membrane protein n=1 Tax=Clostridium acetobutylicum (strain ATCC 824 / DSM 792 / JCM 1419 / IAM 19013 / LMG 5710 / NBRC 13948 / NRRL B-527 / VKM B-1787 / 2291 / W) TaxID=272562 RepID=Q97CZ6_CLOAB|nr:Predicted membrane protein [Clostridium acetobutylicum ATCC 824]ADZ22737.1 membrane protein [Clostridium acetobutylicum EA 2018]AEI32993.1 membrane protein [Clostridium acetobutylicum DSM 1731]AWV80711.1 hypothetical protein DK921_11490 [Clostridium acetobutylicum]PSM05300.1 hypothetical protein C7T89_11490 [Clostridium sp. NJ4]